MARPGRTPLTILLVLACITVVFVLVFDYTNGFHDAANIVATVIASRAMTPAQAVMVVGVFEFLGPVLGGTAVANTIGGVVQISDLQAVQSVTLVLAGLTGAIVWNLVTWWIGLPSSSSHALVGGLVGAVWAATGSSHVVWGFHELFTHAHFTGVTKVLAALMISPVAGFVAGFILHRLMKLLLRAAHPRVNRWLRLSQFVTAAGLAFSHGANDAQKSMGIVTLVLVLGGFIPTFAVPFWVILACATALTLGIMSGGWRIVRTLGFAIYRVRPLHALDSQLAAASVILAASALGAPVSTTHVVTSTITGIGSSERIHAVRWGKVRAIVFTWFVTIPGAAATSLVIYALIRVFVSDGR